MDPDARWERWRTWLGENPKPPSIYEDVVAMMAPRQVWDSFNRIYGAAPEEARSFGTFQSWVAQNYVRFLALGIRRQCDTRADVISLGRLLHDIAANPEVLSRERHRTLHQPEMHGMASGWFDDLAGPGREFIDPAIPERDLADLLSGTELVREWVNKEIAHYDEQRGQFGVGLTFASLHQGLELIHATMNKYMHDSKHDRRQRGRDGSLGVDLPGRLGRYLGHQAGLTS